MIKIKVSGIIGFGIHPNLGNDERKEILGAVPLSPRVAFVDLAPTREIMMLVDMMASIGSILCFVDHHLDPSRYYESRNAEFLKSSYPGVVITTRKEASSASRLVKTGQWKRTGVSVVFFHADGDGLLGFLKGRGVTYPEMDRDADVFDGVRGKLSKTGSLLAGAQENIGPVFSQDPEGFYAAKQRVYQTIADWIADGCQSQVISEFAKEVRIATLAAEALATDLAMETKILPGRIAFADFIPLIEKGEKISFSKWKEAVIRLNGNVLLCSTGIGHMGYQVYIELPKAWSGKIDLRDFLPKGIECRMPFRVQVPLDRLPEFLAKWRKPRKKRARSA